MKVKMVIKSPDEVMRPTSLDIHTLPRNYNPDLHPFAAQREYMRALNAAKINKMMAKPFIAALDGHQDVVSCMAKNPMKIATIASGSCDGELRIWNIATKECIRKFIAHEGSTRGLVFNTDGSQLLSIGADNNIKVWNGKSSDTEDEIPLHTMTSESYLLGITHHQKRVAFATCGVSCLLWDTTSNHPIKTFVYNSMSSTGTLSNVKFNQIDTDILAACASDRSIILYDIRNDLPVHKIVLSMPSTCLNWNPMESYMFSCGSDSYSCFTFDTRRLNKPVVEHLGHVAAVTSIDYSPTGKEFVSGSFDKTIRMFSTASRYSKEVYHTKRMQRVTDVKWSLDSKYVLSASDEMNIRIWKANASEKMGPISWHERQSLQYSAKLRRKFAHFPEIGSIERHRHVPKNVYVQSKQLHGLRAKEKRKLLNKRIHSKLDIDIPDEKDKVVLNAAD